MKAYKPAQKHQFLGWKNYLFYSCFQTPRSVTRYGSATAGWAIDDTKINSSSKVLSAGVGHDISFEKELVEKFSCDIVLLDPSPTAQNTMQRPENAFRGLEFLPLGLAEKDGPMGFARPSNESEGSFRPSFGSENELSWNCRTVSSLMRERNWNKIDLLKMDIEGFEYDVLNELLNSGVVVEQICVEYHWGSGFTGSRWDLFKSVYRLHRAGFSLIFHENADHTFVRR